MAYAAVSCVIELLEYLLQFIQVILRVRQFQFKIFSNEAQQLTRLAEETSSSSYIIEKVRGLLNFMQILIKEVQMPSLGVHINHHCLPETIHEVDVFEEVAEMLEEISNFEAELEKFSERFPEIFEKSDDLPILLTGRYAKFDAIMMYKNFFSASAELKFEINFIYREAMKIKGFCNDLRLLRAFLWDFANPCENPELAKHLEKCISGVLNSAEKFISENLLDIQLKLNAGEIQKICETYSDPERLLCQISRENRGITSVLLSTLEGTEPLIEKVKTLCHEALGNQILQSPSIWEEVSKLPLHNEDIVVGLDDISNDILFRLVMGQPEVEILPIIGMGGIGKTTLAKKIFNHSARVRFHPCAWITVSQIYKLRDLLLGLLLSAGQPTDKLYEKNNRELEECLYRSLKGRKYLIVIDDVWSINVWDDVKRLFPDDKVGSRIILTTRLKKVAAYVNPKIPHYNMSLLNADESWLLLKGKVFGKEMCPPELVDSGKQIAEKCQGLPLAIVVLAGHLSRIKRTFECWKDVADKVSLLVETNPEKCLDILALSYKCLPCHLKACFLYMAVFPEHWEIEVEKLINLWIAEGFIDRKASNSLEGVGHELMEDLVDRSLVMVGKRCFNGKIKTCHIHDLLRELCLREAKKEKFIHAIKRDSQGFPSKLNDERRLSFHLESDGNVHLLPSLPFIRSFFCFSMGSGFSPDIFLCHLHFKMLRVLDIGFLQFDNFPNQILELVLLKYLELTISCDFLAPPFNLMNLHTLVVHVPWTAKHQSSFLHLQYWNMPWLRHLHISATFSLTFPLMLKDNLSYPFTPKFLQTLSTVQFSSCTRRIFKVMPDLRKLGICETKEDYDAGQSSKFLGDLVYLRHLEILKCSFYIQNRAERSNLISGAFPSSIRQLTLSGSCLPWGDMIFIASLPQLEVLKLKNYAFQGPKWTPTEDGFCNLKHLLIDKTDLELWEASSSHFPMLRSLILRSCELLEEIPFSVGEISTLQLLELHYCSGSAEISAEEIGSEFDAVEVCIRSN